MSEHFFGLHRGHLTAKANQIARKHGAWHTNYTEPRGERRGWFSCQNRGAPFDGATAAAVMADIEAAGGIEELLHKRDQTPDIDPDDSNDTYEDTSQRAHYGGW